MPTLPALISSAHFAEPAFESEADAGDADLEFRGPGCAIPWGTFRVELPDPEGRQWSVGTYLPGQPDDN